MNLSQAILNAQVSQLLEMLRQIVWQVSLGRNCALDFDRIHGHINFGEGRLGSAHYLIVRPDCFAKKTHLIFHVEVDRGGIARVKLTADVFEDFVGKHARFLLQQVRLVASAKTLFDFSQTLGQCLDLVKLILQVYVLK